jgi:hypothetical protein
MDNKNETSKQASRQFFSDLVAFVLALVRASLAFIYLGNDVPNLGIWAIVLDCGGIVMAFWDLCWDGLGWWQLCEKEEKDRKWEETLEL